MSPKRAAVLVPFLLLVMAGVMRLVQLDHPGRIFFDESYYVNDARWMLDHGVEEGFAVHPPVGKWLIAAGIKAFGDNPWGWRTPGVIAGALVVLLTYLIAVRLVSWRGAAALAGLLVAVDGLLFVQSRTAMLDVFLGFFVALGAWLLLVDFERSGLGAGADGGGQRHGSQLPPPPLELAVPAGGSSDRGPVGKEREDDITAGLPGVGVVTVEQEDVQAGERLDELPVRGHGFRVLAGAVFGLALATKWSGLLALAAAGLLALGWELGWRRRLTGRLWIGLGSLVLSLTLAFLVVPAVVYVATYAPWFANYAHTTEGAKVCTVDGQPQEPCAVSIPGRIAGFFRYQASVVSFHGNLEAEHSYRAPAYTWPVIGRPVVYYWEYCPEERARGIPTRNEQGQLEPPPPCAVAEEHAGEIIALGNPGLWWVSLAAVFPLAIGAFRRDRRAWYVVSFWGMQFLPWMIVPRPVFFFYMTPAVPFLALAIAYAVKWMDEVAERRRRSRRRLLRTTRLTPGAVAGAVIAIVAVALFVYFYPIYSGMELHYDVLHRRWWFDAWI